MTTSLDALTLQLVGTPYGMLRATRAGSFDDAVILISDDPRDTPLNNILWCAFYLYPRVLVHESTLAARPELQADFQITTPHFGANVSGGTGGSAPGLRAISERARIFAAANWKQ
jgi:hypothetical protein